MPTNSSIRSYSEFVEHLECQLRKFNCEAQDKWEKEALKCVDGLASSELRRLVSLEVRREFGAFFTPNLLAETVIRETFPKLDKHSIIYDCACGAGNLLLSVWDYFRSQKINPVNEHFLVGTDINKEFVDAAKARMAIKKLIFQLEENKTSLVDRNCFSIRNQNGFVCNDFYK